MTTVRPPHCPQVNSASTPHCYLYDDFDWLAIRFQASANDCWRRRKNLLAFS
jgi:hypothetical protein